MKYRRDIDGLRAVAVLPVVLFHFGFASISGGFTGVDVFFVISGYLISGSILHDLERGRFSLIDFYWRRARRILPALFAVCLASTVAALIFLLPSDVVDFSRSMVAASTFWSNIYFWKTTNYFAIDAGLRPLLHTWSLSVEEQFYIFAPLLIAGIYAYGRRHWLAVLAPLILLSFALAVAANTVAPAAGFYLLPTRAWELLLGALLMLRPPPPIRNPHIANLAGAAGLVLLAVGYLTVAETDPFPGYRALYPCLGAALLIHVGQAVPGEGGRQALATRLLCLRPLVWVGMISYSLYLIHWPISAFDRYLQLRNPDLATSLAMVAASLLLAYGSWRFVEQPFRRSGSLASRRVTFGLSAAAIAGLCACGGVGIVSQGLPERYRDFAEQRIDGGDWRTGTCFSLGGDSGQSWNLRDCTRTHGHAKTVLLWGDSFAAHYVSGFAANAGKLQANIVQYTYAGCPPILSYFSYARPGCTTFNRRALDVIREAGISTVILSGRWSDYGTRGFAGLQETIDVLRNRGVEVFVIGQSPEFITDVQKIAFFMRRRNMPGESWPMAMDRTINARVAAFAERATFIDPLKALCSDGRCPYASAHAYLYFDYGHFSGLGAARAIAAYWPSFR
ncbi:acyltransferase family protein [Methylobacterium sp. CM6257]